MSKRYVIDEPGFYRALVEPNQSPIVYRASRIRDPQLIMIPGVNTSRYHPRLEWENGYPASVSSSCSVIEMGSDSEKRGAQTGQ